MALSATDIEPVAHESRDRIITGTVTIVPMLALAVAAWQAWEGLLRPLTSSSSPSSTCSQD